MFLLRGVSKVGQVVFYTGRAGEGWVSADRAEAFTYGLEGARSKATNFNQMTALHGIHFTAQPKDPARMEALAAAIERLA